MHVRKRVGPPLNLDDPIYSLPVTDEDHVCQNCRGAPGGQNRDIHLTFRGRDCNALRHDYQASLHFTALGNNVLTDYGANELWSHMSGPALFPAPRPSFTAGILVQKAGWDEASMQAEYVVQHSTCTIE